MASLCSLMRWCWSSTVSLLRCKTGEYLQVLVPVSLSKAITCTQQVFRHGYPLPQVIPQVTCYAQVPMSEDGTITNTHGTLGSH